MIRIGNELQSASFNEQEFNELQSAFWDPTFLEAAHRRKRREFALEEALRGAEGAQRGRDLGNADAHGHRCSVPLQRLTPPALRFSLASHDSTEKHADAVNPLNCF